MVLLRSRRLVLLLLLGGLFFGALSRATIAAGEVAAEQSPKSRFFYNDDGDRVIFLLKGPFHETQLYNTVDVLVGTAVTTLVYCVSDDTARYPSEVASGYEWRRTAYVDMPGNAFQRLYLVTQQLRQEGIDPVKVIMERAVRQGLEFVPSLRMNDGHFGQKEPATKHPRTSRFWMENRELAIEPGSDHFPTCVLDFTHEKVRNYRLAQIREIINRYAVDGFEMDFTRHYMFFPSGKQRPELITEMVRKTRGWLDEKTKQDDKRRMLIVRVARSLDCCRVLGCDVPTWVKEGLVDYLVPSSPDRYFTFDLPIEEFIEVAKGTRCRAVASPDSWKATPDMYRAGICNYYAKGQQDTYLFNFFTPRAEQRQYFPFRNEDYALLRDLKGPVTLWGRPKLFGVDHFFRGGGRIALAKPGKNYDVGIYVGEDLAACREAMILKHARLNLKIEGRQDGDQLEIALNGHTLQLGDAELEATSITFDLKEPLPRKGHNTVTVTVKKLADSRRETRPTITWLELATAYDITGVLPP